MKRHFFAKGGTAPRTPGLPLADFGYEFPAGGAVDISTVGPIITVDEMREIGRETISTYQGQVLRAEEDPKPQGRHSLEDPVSRYQDLWARRYWRSQAGIERGRLDRGFAKHRAHRDPFPVEPPAGEDDL